MKKTLLRSLIKPEHRNPGVLSMEELDDLVEVTAAPAVDGDASVIDDEVVDEVVAIADAAEVAAEESDELDEGIDAEEELDDAVATMEALLADNGIPSTFELALVMESANDALAVWEIQSAPAVSMEGLASEEARREAASLALEDLKEKLAVVKQGVADGFAKVKERVGSIAERIFSAAKRAEDRASKMLQAVEAAAGKEKKADSFQLSKGVLGQLSAGNGQMVNLTQASKQLGVANKELIEKFANNLTVFLKKGMPAAEVAIPNNAALRGLPRDPEVVKVVGKFAALHLEKPKFRGDRKGVTVPSLEELKAITSAVGEAMSVAHNARQSFGTVISAGFSGYAKTGQAGAQFDEQGRGVMKQFNRALALVNDWNGYQLVTAHAMLSFVAAALKQYGATAPAEGGEGAEA